MAALRAMVEAQKAEKEELERRVREEREYVLLSLSLRHGHRRLTLYPSRRRIYEEERRLEEEERLAAEAKAGKKEREKVSLISTSYPPQQLIPKQFRPSGTNSRRRASSSRRNKKRSGPQPKSAARPSSVPRA